MGGRANRIIVAAVVAGLLAPPLVALVVVGILGAGDARRDVDDARAHPSEVVLSRATTLTDRLQDEHGWWALGVLGARDALVVAPTVDAASPQRTDQAIADLRGALHDHPEAQGAEVGALAAAVDGLTGLAEVRRDAEAAIAASDGGNLGNTAAAQAVDDAYGGPILAILDGTEDMIAETVEDEDARQGAHVQVLARRQLHLTDVLGRDLMLATVGGGADTPEEISALAERAGRWEASLAELSSAPAAYGALVADHLPEDVTGSLAGHSEQVLLEGAADVTLVLADTEAVTTGIERLEDAVEVRRADDLRGAVDAAHAREQRSLLLAGSALVGLVALAVVVIVLLVQARSRPSSGPPSGRGPGVQPPAPPPMVSNRG